MKGFRGYFVVTQSSLYLKVMTLTSVNMIFASTGVILNNFDFATIIKVTLLGATNLFSSESRQFYFLPSR